MKKKVMKKKKVVKKKAMKAPRAMKIAPKTKLRKFQVFQGKFSKTASGLTKDGLAKNKDGKIVSKKQQATGKQRFKNVKPWIDAIKKARKEMGVSGFVAVKKGSDLYTKARAIFDAST